MKPTPKCIECGQDEHMVIEAATPTMRYYHCKYCGTKNQEPTAFGIMRPFVGIALFLLLGIKFD